MPSPALAATSPEHQGDAFRYLNIDGELVEGVVWCPGPAARSVWVLPEAGARAADAVAVKLAPRRKGGGFDGDHRQIKRWPTPPSHNRSTIRLEAWAPDAAHIERMDYRYAPALSDAYWRDALAADPTVGRQLETEDVA